LSLARFLSQRDDEFEAVLAVGLLRWKPAPGVRVCRHVVTRRLRILIDKASARVDVKLDLDAALRMEDGDFLRELPGYGEQRIEAVRDAIATGEQHPLASGVVELLEDWRRLAFDQASSFSSEWTRPQAGGEAAEAELMFSPAIILRRRDRNAWVEYYDRIESTLTGLGPRVPLGLAQIAIPLDEDERAGWDANPGSAAAPPAPLLGDEPLFPLATNAQQRDILERLRHETCVVVQGPPGTGKTHTIANLVSALLAQGQRVLVTSQKDQALRVLRDKLPREIQQLCVLMTTRSKGGASSDLEQTLSSFADHLATSRGADLTGRIAELEDRRFQLRRRHAQIEERVRRLRVAEAVEHEDVAPGYRGTLAEISESLRRTRSGNDWTPRPVPDGAEAVLGRLGRLRELWRSSGPERAASLEEWLPRPERMLAPAAFQTHAERLRRLRSENPQPIQEEWADRLARLDEQSVGELEKSFAAGRAAVHELGLGQQPADWIDDDWRIRVLEDAVAARRMSLWRHVVSASGQISADQVALSRLGPRAVDVPTLARHELEAFRRDAHEWAEYLTRNGRPSKRSVRELRNRVEPALARCLVDGRVPGDPASIGVVLTHLSAAITLENVAAAYTNVGVGPLTGSLVARQDEYRGRAEALESAWRFRDAVQQTKALLTAKGIHVLLDTPQQWYRFGRALEEGRTRAELMKLEAAFDALADEFAQDAGKHAAIGALSPLVAAIRSLDVEEYIKSFTCVERIRHDKADEEEFRRLSHEASMAYPALAGLLAATPDDARWDDLDAVYSALRWGRAADFVAGREPAGTEQRLNAELQEIEQSLLDVTAELAAVKAWRGCRERMTQPQRSALQAFRLAVARVGKGTGDYAGRSRAAARSAMAVARSAVPAWVVPINQVVETIPPEPDAFDVVIVDEASQVGIEALFLQWLAPRVVIVGDDRQCVPGYGGRGVHEVHHGRLETLLPDMPTHLREGLSPGNSLYEMMTVMAPLPVRLSEHFRCMPEIIGWSSRQFYGGALDPVRQFGTERLDPLKVVQVEGGFTDGKLQDIRNPVEAKCIVECIRELFDDPRYQRRSFGVITLQGTGQARLLSTLIEESFEQAEIERHDLRVGTPADFQGDERDVVMLSMIIAETAVARTSRDDQRRYNVAASRAADQLWLFVSIEPSRLREDDLRSSLVRYMLSPPPTLGVHLPDLGDVRGDQLHHPFESLFEQRVYLRIRERGFSVVPQFPVSGRKIDLVVIGAGRRLAVECDGTYWHSSPDKQREDLRRERELVRVGWRFWRVRESSFNLDPDAALEPLWERLSELGIGPSDGGSPFGPSPEAPAAQWSPIPLPADDAVLGDGVAAGEDEAE
jgi:very-short-patch-repair endonuclease